MTAPAPLVDSRSSEDLVRETEELMRGHLGLARDAPVPGGALVRIFARLAEVVIERLNRVPEKNFLAFLDLIGVSPLPPQPARVPLTFALAAGAEEAVVPARTPVAAVPRAGEDEPPTFETERDLVVMRAGLVAALVREPVRDRYANVFERAVGRGEAAFAAFQGEHPIAHAVYVGAAHFALDPRKTIVVELGGRGEEAPWPYALAWSRWDGAGWAPLEASSSESGPGRWRVAFGDVPAIPPSSVGGVTAPWLRAFLRTSVPHGEIDPVEASDAAGRLRQRELAPDAAFSDGGRLLEGRPLHPFGERIPQAAFYLACERAFSKPGAAVAIDVVLEAGLAVEPTGDLELAWEYWDGTEWAWLATTRPGVETEVDRAAGSEFDDGTEAFTRSGRVSFLAPAGWAPRDHGGVTSHWLRARVAAGEYGTPRPALARVDLAYAWLLPQLTAIAASVVIDRGGLAAEAAFTNEVPVDLGKDFLPFGSEPAFNYTLYLASEAFSHAGAAVKLEVALTNPGDERVTPPRAVPSKDLLLRWEHWNADNGAWDVLGDSGPGASASDRRLEDGTAAFTKDGNVTFTIPKGAAPREVNGRLGSWIRVRIVQGDYGRGATYELKDPTKPAEGYVVVPASFRPPSVRSVGVSYRFEPELETPDAVVTENDFRTAVAAVPLTPFTPPSDTRPALYLGFERPGETRAFANRPTSLFLSVVPALYEPGARGRGDAGPPLVAWEYWNGVRWARLPTTDETRGLTRPGAVGFVAPTDFAASTEFGRTASWLRASWERGRFPSPPRLRRVFMNTVWATHTARIADEVLGSGTGEPGQAFTTARRPVLPGERIEVREGGSPAANGHGGGEAGDGAPGTRAAAAGGLSSDAWVRWVEVRDFHESGPRSRHYVLDRLAGLVRFGDGRRGLVPPAGRANVRATYETGGGAVERPRDTVTQLKAAVPYVEAVTNPEAAGGGADAETSESVLERGPKMLRHRNRAVALADVEDLALEASPDVARVRGVPARVSADAGRVGVVVVARSDEPQPVPSVELLTRVEDAIRARMTPTADAWVAGPGWLAVSVAAEVVPVSLEDATNLETLVLDRLAAFLHPLTGRDGRGWDFGRKPYRSDVFAVVEAVPGVDHVRTLRLVEEATHAAPAPGAFLVYSGAHELTLAGREA